MIWHNLSVLLFTIGWVTAGIPNDRHIGEHVELDPPALLCSRVPMAVYRMTRPSCPPLFSEERDVIGSMVELAGANLPLVGHKLRVISRTCVIPDISWPLGSVVPGVEEVTDEPVPVSEYQARRLLAEWKTRDGAWIETTRGTAWEKGQPCLELKRSEDKTGKKIMNIVNIEKWSVVLDGPDGKRFLEICDADEGECQLSEDCWVFWVPSKSRVNWRTEIMAVAGTLYIQDAQKAYFHFTNASSSYHVEKIFVEGVTVWKETGSTLGFLFDAVGNKKQRRDVDRSKEIQMALDLGRLANAQLNWMCTSHLAADLWTATAWVTNPTDVARSVLSRQDIYAESCGLGCLVVYECQPIEAVQFTQNSVKLHDGSVETICYDYPQILYQIPGTGQSQPGHLDTTRMLITREMSPTACEYGPIRYVSSVEGTVVVVYPGGSFERIKALLVPVSKPLNPELRAINKRTAGTPWSPDPLIPVAHGIHEMRLALSKWTGADHMTVEEIKYALHKRARENALHLNPDAGWVGTVCTVVEYAAEIGGAVFGARFISTMVSSAMQAIRAKWAGQ